MVSTASEVRTLLTEVQEHVRIGDLAAAEAAAARAVGLYPGVSETHNALGVVRRKRGDLAGAAAAYRAALKVDPSNGRAHNNLGEVCLEEGDAAGAEPHLKQAIALMPQSSQAYVALARALVAQARPDEALTVLTSGFEQCGPAPALLYERAALAHDRGDLPVAIEAYRAFLSLQPESHAAQVNYASALLDAGRFNEALTAFQAVRTRWPDDLAGQHGYHETLSRMVPPWHVPMMNEDQRNFAYREAIRAAVRSSDHVLEIGTGAGLLAMLAAEAGARRVTTCEMVPVVAAAAREIIAGNGFADRVQVLSMKSTDVRIPEHMPEPADILVSEILANDFVGEGVLPSLLDAKARLLKPGARIIPGRGAMMGVLVGGEAIRYLLEVDRVCGFDMRAFSRFKPWSQSVPQPIDYAALSDDVPLVTYDFNDDSTLNPARGTVHIPVTHAGRCYGVLQWIRIELTPGVTYENHPRHTQSVWNKVLYAFPEPRDVEPGDSVPVHLWHSESHFYLTG